MKNILAKPPKYEYYNISNYQTQGIKWWFDNYDGPSFLNYGINTTQVTPALQWIGDE